MPPQDEVTDGKMTLGLDISSDLKHERWSFNLSLFPPIAKNKSEKDEKGC